MNSQFIIYLKCIKYLLTQKFLFKLQRNWNWNEEVLDYTKQMKITTSPQIFKFLRCLMMSFSLARYFIWNVRVIALWNIKGFWTFNLLNFSRGWKGGFLLRKLHTVPCHEPDKLIKAYFPIPVLINLTDQFLNIWWT